MSFNAEEFRVRMYFVSKRDVLLADIKERMFCDEPTIVEKEKGN